MEKVDLEKIECTDAEPVDDLVGPSTSQGTAEEEACPQPVSEAKPQLILHLLRSLHRRRNRSMGKRGYQPRTKEAELEEPQLEAAAEVEEAVEITGRADGR